jgi:ABC-type antimicrobial peptide transport system permease subunit
MVLLVRGALNPVSLVPSIRQAVWAVDGNIPIADLRTLDDVVASSIGQPRMMALLLGSFGLLGLLLGAIGIYGVTSYAVSQRASELGLRMALGAQRRDVLRLVIVDALRLAAIGIGIGLVAAFWLSRLLRAQLYGVQPTDVATFVAVAVVLSIAGLLAATAPAWRASRIDPLIALREA